MGLCYTVVSSFVANLNSFTNNNKSCKVMQRDIYGISVVKDAPPILQYKIIIFFLLKKL